MHPLITLDDLDSALEWVSASGAFDNAARISKATGQIFYSSTTFDTEDELPDDIDDASSYWSVPHKNDLDLGRSLVYRFIDENLPEDFRKIEEMFHRRGAYSRFKDFLERRGRLESWYKYESSATRTALLSWAAEQGLTVAQSGNTEA